MYFKLKLHYKCTFNIIKWTSFSLGMSVLSICIGKAAFEKIFKNTQKNCFHSSQLFSVHQKPATTISRQRKWKNTFSSIMYDMEVFVRTSGEKGCQYYVISKSRRNLPICFGTRNCEYMGFYRMDLKIIQLISTKLHLNSVLGGLNSEKQYPLPPPSPKYCLQKWCATKLMMAHF